MWSTERGDAILPVTMKRWLECSQSLGIKLYVASDSNELQYPNVIQFNSSSWKKEWLSVISHLKSEGYQNIISILDDFYLLNTLSIDRFQELHKAFLEKNMGYLALEAHASKKNILNSLTKKNRSRIEFLNKNDRYPSSLRPSIWSLELLSSTVEESNSIWEFEHKYLPSYLYASTIRSNDQFKVRHLLEKGGVNYNIIYTSKNERAAILKSYNYDYSQIYKMPKIVISNILIILFGYRIHDVYDKCRHSSL